MKIIFKKWQKKQLQNHKVNHKVLLFNSKHKKLRNKLKKLKVSKKNKPLKRMFLQNNLLKNQKKNQKENQKDNQLKNL